MHASPQALRTVKFGPLFTQQVSLGIHSTAPRMQSKVQRMQKKIDSATGVKVQSLFRGEPFPRLDFQAY